MLRFRKRKSKNLSIFAAAMSGHILEFYDFTIFAVFSLVIGALYFPNSSEITQLLATLSIYAAGFFMRPLGGVIFGHIGDKYGRKIALSLSVSFMAIATFAIGFLPDYEAIGIMAPLLLMLLRFLQGICVGGDGVGSSIFVLEHIADLKPGVIGGIVNAALTVGILLALFAGILINQLFPGDMHAWRYAFMAGGVMGFVGLYLRLKIGETPVFQQLEKEDKVESLPIKKVFTESINSCIVTMVAGAITGAMAYIVMVYLNVFLKSYAGFSTNAALYITAYANICLIVLLPLFGILSDRIGYARQMEYAAISTIALSVPLYMLLASGNLFYILFASTIFAVLVAAVYSPLYPYIIVLFPAEQRYSGVACSLNIGIALLGGTCAVISLQLINMTKIMWSPAIYISAICFLFLITNRVLRQRNKYAVEAQEII